MAYVVDYEMDYEVFDSYRDAEVYCGERGIPGENIYEVFDEDLV